MDERHTLIFHRAHDTPISSMKRPTTDISLFDFYFCTCCCRSRCLLFSIITFSSQLDLFFRVGRSRLKSVGIDDWPLGMTYSNREHMQNQSILSQSFIKFNYMVFGRLCVLQAIYQLIIESYTAPKKKGALIRKMNRFVRCVCVCVNV